MLHRVLFLCVVVGLRWNEKVLLGRDTLCFIIYINNEFVVWGTKKTTPPAVIRRCTEKVRDKKLLDFLSHTMRQNSKQTFRLKVKKK